MVSVCDLSYAILSVTSDNITLIGSTVHGGNLSSLSSATSRRKGRFLNASERESFADRERDYSEILGRYLEVSFLSLFDLEKITRTM